MCPLICTSLAMSSALRVCAQSLGFLMGYVHICLEFYEVCIYVIVSVTLSVTYHAQSWRRLPN